MLKGRNQWDRTRRKPIFNFRKKNFPNKSKKYKCGKRLKHHHYLCDRCWENLQKHREERLSGTINGF